MKNKILAISMIIVIVTVFYSNFITKAETLSEKQQQVQERREEAEQKLTYVQEDLSAAIVKIQELDDQIRQSESEIESLNGEVENLETQIEELTTKIEQVEKNYNDNEALLEERLVTMYEVGETKYLDILFNSAGIMDFLSNYYIIQQMIESDTILLDEIEQ